jgi:hypothetical protein
MIQINKIKMSEETVIVYEERIEDSYSTKVITLSSKEPPVKQFQDAIASLMEYVAEFCKLDWEFWETGSVTGINFKYDDMGNFGITITAQNKFELPCVINTPYISPNMMIEHDLLLSTMNDIQQHSLDFIEGKRKELEVKQLTLL